MRAIGEATAEGHQPLAVLQLDLRQAFDRVSHRFLLAALDRFGVGEELREWIALCYRDISTRLLINGQRGGPISIGSRAHVCNTVSYRAVLYRAQAVCCPGSQAGKVHRNWAMFVWKSAMESTRRNNLFLHQESGGLGLVNIVLKLHVQRFLLFRDARDPTFIAVLHHLGFPHLGNWMVSTSGRTTKGAALRFYKEIASSIEFLQAQFSWECLATVGKRRLYWDAVSASFPPPLYRQPPTPDDATRLYKLVRILPIPVATRDFFVRMHMEVLPVKTWLHHKGFFVPWSLNCDLCGAPETIQHVLVECSNAYLFWDEMRTTFELRDSFEVEWSVFKYLQLEERDKTEVAHVMMLLGLHAIWQSRTAMVQCHLDARPTWSYFVSTLGWVLSVTSRQPNAGDWECIERQLEEGRRRCAQRRTSGVGNWRVPVNCRRVGVG
ncbi:hypothetical protein ISCGN_008405 [Ixodes scapularis]